MWAIVIHASAEARDFRSPWPTCGITNPCEGPLDDPAARQDFKTLGLVGTFDDLECPFPNLQPLFQLVARIAAIGEDMKQPWPSVPDGFQEIRSAVAILNIGTMHHEADHQPECIDNDVALATLDLLASIKASDTTAFSGFDALAIDGTGRR